MPLPIPVPLVIVIYLLVINATTYLAFKADKEKARRGEWRIRETRLHFLCLIGGSPGGWLAMRRFRHKTSKTSFRAMFWMIVALQILAIVLLGTPLGDYVNRRVGASIFPQLLPE